MAPATAAAGAREGPGEDGQTAQDALFFRPQPAPGVFQGGAQAAPGLRVASAGPARAQVEPPDRVRHQVARREQPQPLRRQREGQGQPAQEVAEPVGVGPVGGVEGPSAAGLAGVGQEQGAGGGVVQVLRPVREAQPAHLHRPLLSQPQARPRGGQDAQPGRRVEQVAEYGRARLEVLHPVQHQQRYPLPEGGREGGREGRPRRLRRGSGPGRCRCAPRCRSGRRPGPPGRGEGRGWGVLQAGAPDGWPGGTPPIVTKRTPSREEWA